MDRTLSRRGVYISGIVCTLAVAAFAVATLAGGNSDGRQHSAASFPADTVVLTPDGPVPIDLLRAGQEVITYDADRDTAGRASIIEITSRSYSGDMIHIVTDDSGGDAVSATARHPFWVLSGGRLASRSAVPGGRALTAEGRWVAAADLRRGDALLAVGGSRAVRSVSATSADTTVYDLRVAGVGAVAVGGGVFASDLSRDETSSVPGRVRGGGLLGSDAASTPEPLAAVDEEMRGSGGVAGPPAPRTEAAARVSESGLSAGYSDDNLEFGAYLRFLEEYAQAAPHIPIAVNERIVFSLADSNGRTVPNAVVSVRAGGRVIASGRTYSDGRYLFFPSEHGDERRYTVTFEYGTWSESIGVDRQGVREVPVEMAQPRESLQQVPLDVLFVLDTTGSMGEEIDRLTQSIEIIHLNLTSLPTSPRVRFGMVLYKDRGDEYTTRTVALTPDIDAFRSELQNVYASGGGDYPEDLQSALVAATRQIDWDPRGVRLVFVITDAPPQLYPDQKFTYVEAAHAAHEAGIRLYTVGTGGMDIQGEYPLRQLSQYTGAKYIFLTYGETGESAGGVPGSVSHHTGANYETDKLEAIIIRFAKEELQHLTDVPIEVPESYFTADPVGTEDREATLRSLFSSAISQLLAYSSWAIPDAAPAAVIPFHPSNGSLGVQAEYLSEQLLLTMRQDETARGAFTLVERRDMQAILEEIEFQLSGLADGASVTRVGQFLGAQLLLSGSLYDTGENYELFIRLLRVETGEVLAVTKAVIDRRLVP